MIDDDSGSDSDRPLAASKTTKQATLASFLGKSTDTKKTAEQPAAAGAKKKAPAAKKPASKKAAAPKPDPKKAKKAAVASYSLSDSDVEMVDEEEEDVVDLVDRDDADGAGPSSQVRMKERKKNISHI